MPKPEKREIKTESRKIPEIYLKRKNVREYAGTCF